MPKKAVDQIKSANVLGRLPLFISAGEAVDGGAAGSVLVTQPLCRRRAGVRRPPPVVSESPFLEG